MDKNRSIRPVLFGYVNDSTGAYEGGWAMPTLPSRVGIRGIDRQGVFVTDLEGFTYDGLPGTTFELIGIGLETGGRFVVPTEPIANVDE